MILHQMLSLDEQSFTNGIILSTFLNSVLNQDHIYSTCLMNLQYSIIERGIFKRSKTLAQLSRIKNEIDEIDYYELIIADNSEGNKRMVVLTADGLESELIEMDSSGMHENEIIDLNFEGRRWEGGELKGKPFGFGREYSEEGNLIYEGFVFEGKKVCFGKEWNDDGNNNCLMYEGGYWNDERWGKGISYDLNGNVDFEGEWINNHVITKIENKAELFISIAVERLVIGNKQFTNYDINTLYFPPLLVRLTLLVIEKGCFENVHDFMIDGLPTLESVKIGE